MLHYYEEHEIIMEAARFAALWHGKQKRKSSLKNLHVPYVMHPFEVSQLVGGSGMHDQYEGVLIAAILHDILEDTAAPRRSIEELFGSEVLGLIEELTVPADLNVGDEHKSEGAVSKHDYQLKQVSRMSTPAANIKIADKTSNLRDLVRHPPDWGVKAKVRYIEQAEELVNTICANHMVYTYISNRFDDAAIIARKYHLSVKR